MDATYVTEADFNFDEVFTGFDIDPKEIGFDLKVVDDSQEPDEIVDVGLISQIIVVDMDQVPTTNKKRVLDIPCRINGCISFFGARSSERDHYRSVHLGLTFDCTICNSTLSSKRSLVRHSKLHSGIKCEKERYMCSKCGITFSTKQSLRIHYGEKHTSIVFECGVDGCTRSFTAKTKRAYHIRSYHRGGYPCIKCDRRFFAKFNLDKHMRQTHDGIFGSSVSILNI